MSEQDQQLGGHGPGADAPPPKAAEPPTPRAAPPPPPPSAAEGGLAVIGDTATGVAVLGAVPERPPLPEAIPQSVPDTDDQQERRAALMAKLAGAPLGGLQGAVFEQFLELRAIGWDVGEISKRIDVPSPSLVKTEKAFVEWVMADDQREARGLMSEDPRLWRFLWHYQRAN